MANGQAQKLVGADTFFYQTSFPAVAPGAAPVQPIQIDGDSRFRLHKITMFADLAGAAQTDSTRVIPVGTVLIQDNKSGRQLMTDPISLGAMFGDGRLPFILPRQKTFPASSVIRVTFTNTSAGTTYNLQLVFIGEKLFSDQAPGM